MAFKDLHQDEEWREFVAASLYFSGLILIQAFGFYMKGGGLIFFGDTALAFIHDRHIILFCKYIFWLSNGIFFPSFYVGKFITISTMLPIFPFALWSSLSKTRGEIFWHHSHNVVQSMLIIYLVGFIDDYKDNNLEQKIFAFAWKNFFIVNVYVYMN